MQKLSPKLVLVLLSLFFVSNSAVAQVNPNAQVESIVRQSFPDMPDMITIAKCESGFRQFGPDGQPLRGGTGKKYIGIFQIGESLHSAKALSMAYDINTIEGNIAYARHMYFASGTKPWVSCLTTAPIAAPVATIDPTPVVNTSPVITSGSITMNLNPGMNNSQVRVMQQLLNKSGFVISASGPGSPGNETNYFGAMTKEALKKFQCAKAITCDGNESTTGFGRVGPKTRAVLNTL